MVRSVNVTVALLEDIATELEEGSTLKPLEWVVSGAFPGGSTHAALVEHLIGEVRNATTSTVYTARLTA